MFKNLTLKNKLILFGTLTLVATVIIVGLVIKKHNVPKADTGQIQPISLNSTDSESAKSETENKTETKTDNPTKPVTSGSGSTAQGSGQSAGSGSGSTGGGTTPPPVTPPSFPTQSSVGVPSSFSLTTYPFGSYRSDTITTTTESINGITWQVIEGYTINLPAGQYFYVPSGNVLFRNVRIIASATPSNTGALIQGSGATNLWLDNVDVWANGWARGVQSDGAHLKVTDSEFIDTSDAAIEKNSSTASSDLTIDNNYISVSCAWTSKDPGAHADGIQWGGARNVVVTGNTILTNFNITNCESNSTIGGWAEIGNVQTARIENNLLAGGGASVYLEQKSPYAWLGQVEFKNNTFDRRYNPSGGYWCALAPNGLPSQFTWSGNKWEDGSALTQSAAVSGC